MPTDTETVPIYHDEWLATVDSEFWGVADSSREVLHEIERSHHSDHCATHPRDVDLFPPGESPNWMWDLAAVAPETYEQEIEVEVEMPTVEDGELQDMEGFL